MEEPRGVLGILKRIEVTDFLALTVQLEVGGPAIILAAKSVGEYLMVILGGVLEFDCFRQVQFEVLLAEGLCLAGLLWRLLKTLLLDESTTGSAVMLLVLELNLNLVRWALCHMLISARRLGTGGLASVAQQGIRTLGLNHVRFRGIQRRILVVRRVLLLFMLNRLLVDSG